ncbi:MAG: hypothetical protein ACI8XO_005034 [Verrucomicrobiales bacterium]|jgi:hypothetical protein
MTFAVPIQNPLGFADATIHRHQQIPMDNTARNFVDHIEINLLKAKGLLQSGLKTALNQLRGAADQATSARTDEAIAKLRALEDLSETSIDTIEKHLGELNYLAAEGDIRSSADFDKLARPLSEALHDARGTLAKLDEIGRRELGSAAGAISEAWRDLHLALDSARLELALAEKDSGEEADTLRQNLTEKFEEALKVAKAEEPETLREKLHDIALYQVSHFGDGFKNLFGLPLKNPDGSSLPKRNEP